MYDKASILNKEMQKKGALFIVQMRQTIKQIFLYPVPK